MYYLHAKAIGKVQLKQNTNKHTLYMDFLWEVQIFYFVYRTKIKVVLVQRKVLKQFKVSTRINVECRISVDMSQDWTTYG